MSDEIEIAGIKVPRADWEATPASIQMLVQVLNERLLALEEKVNQSSQNLSKPPSTDGFGKVAKAKGKGKPPRSRGAGKPPRVKRESFIQRKIVVPSMRSFPQPATPVGPVYRAKIAIPTAIK